MEEVTEEQAAQLSVPYESTPTTTTTSTPASLANSEAPKEKPKKKVPCRVVKPTLHGEGVNAFVTYEVQTKGHTVVRRFSDFAWLHERLNEEFLDVLIPPVPEKVIINRFSREVVEYRRRLLEKFLRRVMTNPKLKLSQFLPPFLTATESEMPKHRAVKFVNPKVEEKSIFAVAGSFFGGLTGKVEPAQEVDPYFEEQKNYLIGLQDALYALQTLNEERLETRKEIIENLNVIAHAAALLGSVEVPQDSLLGGFWKTLARILKGVSTVQTEIVNAETRGLDDTLKDYILTAEAGQKLLQNRYNLVERVHEAKQKKTANVTTLSEDLQETSTKVKEELNTFKQNKTKDFRDALQITVTANIEQQQKNVALWKELLSELESYND